MEGILFFMLSTKVEDLAGMDKVLAKYDFTEARGSDCAVATVIMMPLTRSIGGGVN